jgi:predicted DNA binding CopG/RHH family protein
MKKEFNFKGAKRGRRVDPDAAKVAITVRLDLPILTWLRTEAEKKAIPYQTLLNSVLKQAMHAPTEQEEWVRKIVREELSKKVG